MKKLLLSIFVFAIVLFICACSAQTPASAPSSAVQSSAKTQQTEPPAQGNLIEPTQLISKAEAEQITGAPLNDTKTTENDVVGQKIADYTTPDGSNYLQIEITQQAFIKTAGITPQSQYDGIKAALSDVVKVEGVGDDAFFAIPGIHIIYRGYYISVSTGLSSATKDQERLKKAGKLACDNLDKLLK